MFHPAIDSIRTRLLFSFLVLLSVPVITLGIIGPLIFSRSIETQTVEHTPRMIARMVKNLEYHVGAVEQLIALSERDPAIAAFFSGTLSDSEEKAALAFMDSCARTHPEIEGMLLVAADDRMLSGFYDRIARNPLTLEPWYMKAVRKQHELTIIVRPIGLNILGGKTLQSPDDEQANFRTKSGKSFWVYVATITETCAEENELQLISGVSVAPNTTDDKQLLPKDIENLKERMGIDELYTEVRYTGETAAQATEQHHGTQYVSPIKGRKKKKRG